MQPSPEEPRAVHPRVDHSRWDGLPRPSGKGRRPAGTDAGAEALYWLGVAHYKLAHDAAQLRPSWQRLAREYPSSEWARRTQIPGKG